MAVLATSLPASAPPATAPPPAARPEDEPRLPWARSDGWFVKTWLVAGPFAEPLDSDPLAGQGGEAALKGRVDAELKRADGTVVRWKESTSWSDAFGVDEALGLTAPDSGTAYAYALVKRAAAGPALLSVGSDDGVRVWVNGKLVHERRGTRPLTFDEDRVPVELGAGENAVLVKTEQRRGPWALPAASWWRAAGHLVAGRSRSAPPAGRTGLTRCGSPRRPRPEARGRPTCPGSRATRGQPRPRWSRRRRASM